MLSINNKSFFQSSVSNTTSGKKNAAGAGKKKKRKSRGSSSVAAQSSSQAVLEQTPPRDDELAIDPDEPTYCLCDQISFGEMILCDNDLCPIEWFHFQCVALTTRWCEIGGARRHKNFRR